MPLTADSRQEDTVDSTQPVCLSQRTADREDTVDSTQPVCLSQRTAGREDTVDSTQPVCLSQRTAGRKILSTAHSLYASHSGQQAGRYCRQHTACMPLTADSRQEDTVDSTQPVCLSQRTAGRKILSTAHRLYASHSGQQTGKTLSTAHSLYASHSGKQAEKTLAHNLYASHSGKQAGRYCRQHTACMPLTADSRQGRH